MSSELPVSETCVFIPTLNEVATIGSVVEGFREQGFDNVLVYDGGSTDGTVDRARAQGARVTRGPGAGKGLALQRALETEIDTSYTVMIDGDGTYHPDEVDILLDSLTNGGYEHVIGNRFAGIEPGAMTVVNQVGNWMFNVLFAFVYQKWYADILSGYRAFTRESVESMTLTERGFGIETELTAQCAVDNIPTDVVPITYSPRPDGSNSKLSPLRDGAVICSALFRNRME